MERRDWNLLVLSAAGGEPFSPVQLQKSLFLLEKTLPSEVLGEGFYHFDPYNYGPFDSDVYADASILTFGGWARASQSSRGRWTEYAATPAGIKRAKELAATLPEGIEDYIGKIVRWVREQSFTSLVREIYRHFPEMKANSVFRD
jgi:uncharacterized protein